MEEVEAVDALVNGPEDENAEDEIDFDDPEGFIDDIDDEGALRVQTDRCRKC